MLEGDPEVILLSESELESNDDEDQDQCFQFESECPQFEDFLTLGKEDTPINDELKKNVEKSDENVSTTVPLPVSKHEPTNRSSKSEKKKIVKQISLKCDLSKLQVKSEAINLVENFQRRQDVAQLYNVSKETITRWFFRMLSSPVKSDAITQITSRKNHNHPLPYEDFKKRWNDFNLRDCVYMIASSWKSLSCIVLNSGWKDFTPSLVSQLITYEKMTFDSNVDDSVMLQIIYGIPLKKTVTASKLHEFLVHSPPVNNYMYNDSNKCLDGNLDRENSILSSLHTRDILHHLRNSMSLILQNDHNSDRTFQFYHQLREIYESYHLTCL